MRKGLRFMLVRRARGIRLKVCGLFQAVVVDARFSSIVLF